MLFLQTVVTNLVFTNFSGPKCHAVAFTASIFAGFMCVTKISVGGEGAVAIETFPLLLALTRTPTLISLCMAMGRSAHSFVGNPAHSP